MNVVTNVNEGVNKDRILQIFIINLCSNEKKCQLLFKQNETSQKFLN